MRESAGAARSPAGRGTPSIASDWSRRPSHRIGRTFRPWRRSSTNTGWQITAAMTSESAYSPNVNAGFSGTWRARRTPAGTPGPTGAKNSARTRATGPPGNCCAAWSNRAAPASPAYRETSSVAEGSKTSKGLIGRAPIIRGTARGSRAGYDPPEHHPERLEPIDHDRVERLPRPDGEARGERVDAGLDARELTVHGAPGRVDLGRDALVDGRVEPRDVAADAVERGADRGDLAPPGGGLRAEVRRRLAEGAPDRVDL